MKTFDYEYGCFECPVCKSKLGKYWDSDKPYGKQVIIECKNGCYHVEGECEEYLIDTVIRDCGWVYDY